MRSEQGADDFPLNSYPFAVNNSDSKDAPPQTLSNILKNGVLRLVRTKLMQIESPVDRVLNRFGVIAAHGRRFSSASFAQNHDTKRHPLEQGVIALAKDNECE